MSKSQTDEKYYRKNVAVVVLNDQGYILACRRSDKWQSWQLPQGGIDEGETPKQAMMRELEEEIGTNKVSVLGQLPCTICYDWPSTEYFRGFHGQEQWYFVVRLQPEAKINLSLHPPIEFDKTQWMGAKSFLAEVKGFKRAAYVKALALLQQQLPGLIQD